MSSESHFECGLCDFKSPYDYFGRKPPFVQSMSLKEKAYVLNNPFVAQGGHITVGSHCTVCGQAVCVNPDCSIFYTRRFCLPCVRDNIGEFPQEIQQEVGRKGLPSKE